MVNWNIIDLLRNLFSKVYNKLVVAIIILLVGVVVGRIAGKVVQKLLAELELNNIIRKTTSIKISTEYILSNFVTYLIYFVTIILALDQLGAATTVLYIISALIFFVIITSILLGFRDFFPNIISGIFIQRKRYLNEGDKIQIGDVQGTIIKMSITEIRIKTKKNDIIYIPNSMLNKQQVIKKK